MAKTGTFVADRLMVLVALVLSTYFAQPTDSGPIVDVTNSTVAYFGCGCFWHVQHSLVQAERKLMKRRDLDLTAFAGYAGGKAAGQDGRVCYHNFFGVADYGSLGYAEVVSLALPDALMPEVAKLYLDEICPGGVREDLQDWGAEYRALVGFPGGSDSSMGRAFIEVANQRGVKVLSGAGNDPDRVGTVFVMDTFTFPFHQAEVYHQFHNDMIATYDSAYNSLRQKLVSSGRVEHTGCPSD